MRDELTEENERFALLLKAKQRGGFNYYLAACDESLSADNNDDKDDAANNSSSSSSPPPPPPHNADLYASTRLSFRLSDRAARNNHGSLDFERIVNDYSIQAQLDRNLEQYENQDDDDGHGNDHFLRTSNKFGFRWRRRPKTNLLGYTGRTATRWALSILAGLLTGLTTVVIVSITGFLVQWRTKRLDEMIIDGHPHVFYIFTAVSILLSSVASLLCIAWVPAAAGSGIPEVKAYLNGVSDIGNRAFT